jgi:hypothetical protein
LEGLVLEGLLSAGSLCDGVPTYRMTALVHQYARERLEFEDIEGSFVLGSATA